MTDEPILCDTCGQALEGGLCACWDKCEFCGENFAARGVGADTCLATAHSTIKTLRERVQELENRVYALTGYGYQGA